MKDLSFFLIKNLLGAKMKKGFRNFCNGDGSTSTLTQNPNEPTKLNMVEPSSQGPTTTLEEMIFQLELEEDMARKARARVQPGRMSCVTHSDILRSSHHGLSQHPRLSLDGKGSIKARVQPGRMSCVTQSDILRSAHNALSQYPRFSLDGKDSMYRSSFRNAHRSPDLRRRLVRDEKMARARRNLPQTLAGERVVWCKPGVVAKLMGLDAIPTPARKSRANDTCRDRNSSLVSSLRRQTLRRRAEMHDMGRRRLSVDRHIDC